MGMPYWYEFSKVKWEISQPEPFHQSIWRRALDNNYQDKYVRLRMASDLIDRQLLDGLSREQVTRLLGQSKTGAGSNGLVYWVSPHFIDGMWLRVDFDAALMVREVMLLN